MKPRPLQAWQSAPLVLGLAISLVLMVESSRFHEEKLYLGGLPAQLLQLETVRPPRQAVWLGSRAVDGLTRGCWGDMENG